MVVELFSLPAGAAADPPQGSFVRVPSSGNLETLEFQALSPGGMADGRKSQDFAEYLAALQAGGSPPVSVGLEPSTTWVVDGATTGERNQVEAEATPAALAVLAPGAARIPDGATGSDGTPGHRPAELAWGTHLPQHPVGVASAGVGANTQLTGRPLAAVENGAAAAAGDRAGDTAPTAALAASPAAGELRNREVATSGNGVTAAAGTVPLPPSAGPVEVPASAAQQQRDPLVPTPAGPSATPAGLAPAETGHRGATGPAEPPASSGAGPSAFAAGAVAGAGQGAFRAHPQGQVDAVAGGADASQSAAANQAAAAVNASSPPRPAAGNASVSERSSGPLATAATESPAGDTLVAHEQSVQPGETLADLTGQDTGTSAGGDSYEAATELQLTQTRRTGSLRGDDANPGLTVADESGDPFSTQLPAQATDGPAAAAARDGGVGPRPSAERFASDFRAELAEAKTQQRDTFELELDPPELGRIRVEIREHQGGMDVRLYVAEQSTQHAVLAEMNRLREALQQAGVTLDNLEVSLDFSGPDQQSHQQAGDQAAHAEAFGASGEQHLPSRTAHRPYTDRAPPKGSTSEQAGVDVVC